MDFKAEVSLLMGGLLDRLGTRFTVSLPGYSMVARGVDTLDIGMVRRGVEQMIIWANNTDAGRKPAS
jgi:hypothetical protein